MSSSLPVMILLNLSGGTQDACSYFLRDHVFANAQTGNIVLLGLNIAEGHIRESLYYLLPIAAFALGILFVEWIRARFREYSQLHWRQIVVFLEALLLLLPAFMVSGAWDTQVNILISFVCAVQVESFRKVRGQNIATTMCTGNLRTATEQIFYYLHSHDAETGRRILGYYEMVLFFILGAAAGAVLTAQFAEKSILFCSAMLGVAFFSMFMKEV